MKKIILFCLLTSTLAIFVACGSATDWWSGELGGSAKIIQENSYSGASEIVPAQSSEITFPSYATLKLGKDSPIPDCTIALMGGDANADEQISGFDRGAYKGEVNGGLPCEAFLSKGVPTKVEINQGIAKRNKETGEITITLNFRLLNTGAVNYVYEFHGRKKGWF